LQCVRPLLAHSGRPGRRKPRQLSRVKRTSQFDHAAAANDPNSGSACQNCCYARRLHFVERKSWRTRWSDHAIVDQRPAWRWGWRTATDPMAGSNHGTAFRCAGTGVRTNINRLHSAHDNKKPGAVAGPLLSSRCYVRRLRYQQISFSCVSPPNQ